MGMIFGFNDGTFETPSFSVESCGGTGACDAAASAACRLRAPRPTRNVSAADIALQEALCRDYCLSNGIPFGDDEPDDSGPHGGGAAPAARPARAEEAPADSVAPVTRVEALVPSPRTRGQAGAASAADIAGEVALAREYARLNGFALSEDEPEAFGFAEGGAATPLPLRAAREPVEWAVLDDIDEDDFFERDNAILRHDLFGSGCRIAAVYLD